MVELQLAIIVSVVMITMITVPIVLVMRVALRGQGEQKNEELERAVEGEPEVSSTKENGEA